LFGPPAGGFIFILTLSFVFGSFGFSFLFLFCCFDFCFYSLLSCFWLIFVFICFFVLWWRIAPYGGDYHPVVVDSTQYIQIIAFLSIKINGPFLINKCGLFFIFSHVV